MTICTPGTVLMTAEPLPGPAEAVPVSGPAGAVTTASSRVERYGTVQHRFEIVDAQKTGARVAPDFDEFYATHFRGITVQVYAYFGNMSDAQDVTQEAFCRAFSRWAKIAGYDDPVAWVRRVAWNLATSKWRRMRTAMNFARKHREEHSPEPSPDHVALTTALKTLPERQRRAIVMHYLADLPVAEIARQENVAEGTVKSWLHRARLALAEQLADRANGDAAPVTPIRPPKPAAPKPAVPKQQDEPKDEPERDGNEKDEEQDGKEAAATGGNGSTGKEARDA
jgi:RNA polymerase sigma-70 factor (ECF subfamily)